MRQIALDNDKDFSYALTRRNRTTNLIEPATGLTGLTGRLSATDGGAAIAPALSVPATEEGVLGIYYGTFLGPDLRTNVANLVGQTCYIVFGNATSVFTSEPVQIVATRRPG